MFFNTPVFLYKILIEWQSVRHFGQDYSEAEHLKRRDNNIDPLALFYQKLNNIYIFRRQIYLFFEQESLGVALYK